MKRLLEFVAAEKWGIASGSESDPVAGLAQIETKFGRAKALQGLRTAIGDVVEMFDNASAAEVARLDANLQGRGAMTLSQARALFSKKLEAIVRRGAIRTDGEYYIVRGAVEGAEPGAALQLWALLAAYEQKAVASV